MAAFLVALGLTPRATPAACPSRFPEVHPSAKLNRLGGAFGKDGIAAGDAERIYTTLRVDRDVPAAPPDKRAIAVGGLASTCAISLLLANRQAWHRRG